MYTIIISIKKNLLCAIEHGKQKKPSKNSMHPLDSVI